jgi:hypothetical protein
VLNRSDDISLVNEDTVPRPTIVECVFQSGVGLVFHAKPYVEGNTPPVLLKRDWGQADLVVIADRLGVDIWGTL